MAAAKTAKTNRTKPGPVAPGERVDTRAALIRAAEHQFAADGIDGASLREINRIAGAANAGAVQYHFVDRAGLLRAVIDKHRTDTETRRHALLDQFDAVQSADVRDLSAALILPLASKLDDPDGGRDYLRINCEICTRPDFDAITEVLPKRGSSSSMRRWHERFDPLARDDERDHLHTRYPAMRFAFVELARRAAGPARRDDRLFVSHVIDLVTCLLTSAPSGPTTVLLDRR